MKSFGDWFDVKNKDHILAYIYYKKNEKWPEGFINSEVKTYNNDDWFIIKFKLANEYVSNFIKNNNL